MKWWIATWLLCCVAFVLGAFVAVWGRDDE